MRIPAPAFEQWAKAVTPRGSRYSFASVARLSGMSRSTLYHQRQAGHIDPAAVLSVSRRLHLSPVAELASFDHFRTLSVQRPPSTAEILSQVPIATLLDETLRRYHRQSTGFPREWGGVPGSFRRWLATYDLHGRYADLAHAVGVRGQTEFSAKAAASRFTIGQVVSLSAYADLNARFGLIVLGSITPEEAGLPHDIWEITLRAASDLAVVGEIEKHLSLFGRDLAGRHRAR